LMLTANIKKHNEAYRNTPLLRNLNKPKHESVQNRTCLERKKLAETFRKEIVQRMTRNLLDIQMLRLIQTQPMWGYKIKKQVETKFGVKLRHGALYPLLNALEKKGFLTSEKQRHGGRTRKVYTITRKGKQYLETYNSILREQLEGPDIK
jgi:PadR family transcriptional regulator PadR